MAGELICGLLRRPPPLSTASVHWSSPPVALPPHHSGQCYPYPPALLIFQSTSLTGNLLLKIDLSTPKFPAFFTLMEEGIILLTWEKTTRGPGDFCPGVCFEADHANDEDENPSESMTVLTLSKRRVNKEGSNKSCPGHDLALNCLLQCPDFWPSCQFDAPFLH